MEYECLFAQLEDTLLKEISSSGVGLTDSCKQILSGFKAKACDGDTMVARLSALLNGALPSLLERMRDMAYNIEGKPQSGHHVRAFQYVNETLTSIPVVARYDLGAFFGARLPTLIDLSGSSPTFREAIFEDSVGLEQLKLSSSCGRIPSRFLAGSSIKSLIAPEVYMIGQYAFAYCESLETVDVAEVLGVDNYAFFGCSSFKAPDTFLKNATFIGTESLAGSGVEHVVCNAAIYIGEGAFQQMPALKSVRVSTKLCIFDVVFQDCTVLELVEWPMAERIGPRAFAGCTMLSTLRFEALRAIGDRAFYNSGLEEFFVGDAYLDGVGHFELCVQLKRLIFGASSIIVPARFCYGCSQLEQLTTAIEATPGGHAMLNGKPVHPVHHRSQPYRAPHRDPRDRPR